MKLYSIIVLSMLVLSTLVNTVTTLETVEQTQQVPFKMAYKTFEVEVRNHIVSASMRGEMLYLNLTEIAYRTFPMGLIYDDKRLCIWLALHPECSGVKAKVLKIVEQTFLYSVTEYVFPDVVDENYRFPFPWTLCVDKNNELWISIRAYGYTPRHPPPTVPFLAKLNPETNNLTIYYIPYSLGKGCHVLFYKDSVWYLTDGALSRINITSETIEEIYYRYGGAHMVADESIDCLWVSYVTTNTVSRFSLKSRTFDANVTWFDRPNGLFVDCSNVYVAESSFAVSRISVINKTDLTVKRITTNAKILHEGTQFVCKSSLGNIWWTDASNHYGVILSNGTKRVFPNISPYGFFISEVPGNTIWLSAKGSAYVGIINELMVVSKFSYGSMKDDCLLR